MVGKCSEVYKGALKLMCAEVSGWAEGDGLRGSDEGAEGGWVEDPEP